MPDVKRLISHKVTAGLSLQQQVDLLFELLKRDEFQVVRNVLGVQSLETIRLDAMLVENAALMIENVLVAADKGGTLKRKDDVLLSSVLMATTGRDIQDKKYASKAAERLGVSRHRIRSSIQRRRYWEEGQPLSTLLERNKRKSALAPADLEFARQWWLDNSKISPIPGDHYKLNKGTRRNPEYVSQFLHPSAMQSSCMF